MGSRNLVLLTLELILLDQATKFFLLNNFPSKVVFNRGIAFGLVPSAYWIIIDIVIIFYFLLWGRNLFASTLIIAGGISNLIDRATLDKVVDYLDLSIWLKSYSWIKFLPVFNLADVYICLGAGALVIGAFFCKRISSH